MITNMLVQQHHVIPSNVLVGRFSVGAPMARSAASSWAKNLQPGNDEVVVTRKGKGVFLMA